ncbi:hypothetical protein FGG08_003418 [Glutinoglossum americanum]|uniref:Uncharacterized protein n=1 Tax=Glutinoglossum americanum TaxID=1670608 RepID=A0A9P8I2T0_9PEZI|nr:hypothetical protein FGG08_003418 [Glutinoglossum americanum]
MPTAAAEADIIQNRINVALAKSQRLVASWLPSSDSTNTRSAEEIQEEEDALFTPIPPRLGLGAPIPKEFADGDTKKQKEFILNDKIRRRMIGNRPSDLPSRPQGQLKRGPPVGNAGANTPRSGTGRAAEVETDSDDESRSSLWRTKHPKVPPTSESANGRSGNAVVASPRERPSTSKRRTNFLDEFLLEKSKKRKGNDRASKSKRV